MTSSQTIKSGKQLEALHLQIQDLLSGYVDGELLDKQETALVEAHLAGCRACAADVERQRLLQQQLASFPRSHLNPAQHAKLDEVLENASKERTGNRLRQLSAWKKLNTWFQPRNRFKLAAAGSATSLKLALCSSCWLTWSWLSIPSCYHDRIPTSMRPWQHP